MKQFVVAAFAFGLLVNVSGCGSSPKDMIIGKWEGSQKGLDDKDVAMTVEFMKDGKMKTSTGPLSIEGTYKFTDNDTIEMTMEFLGQKKTLKGKVKVTKDELEVPDEGDKTLKLKRAK